MTPHPFNAHAGWAPPGSLQKSKPPALPPGQLCQVLAATQVANGWQVDYLELSPKSDVNLGIETNALPVEAPNADRWTALIPSAVSAAKPKTGALIIVFDAPSSDFKWAILAPDIQKTADDAASTGPAYGIGSILGMGPADCVEFSSPGGVGRCSPVLAFSVKGTWTGTQEWTAVTTVSTPLGDMTLVFSVVDDVPILVGVFSGGSAPDPVVFKLVDVGSSCAIFVTTDRRVCTAAPGGPCETNALVVAVCCKPCGVLVSQTCDPPVFDMITSVCGEGVECFYSAYSGSPGDLASTSRAQCLDYSVNVSVSWNADRTALVATLIYQPGLLSPVILGYETVAVLSWLPFHATITTTADYPYIGAAGTVFELWQRNDDGGGGPYTCADVGPQPQVECENCPGGAAPHTWMLDACCLVNQKATTNLSDSKPSIVYQGGCVWHTNTSSGGTGYTITIADGKVRLEFPPSGGPSFNQSYEADVPASCCEPIVLTRVNDIAATAHTAGLGPMCLPRFPEGSTIEWPDTVTIIPYGTCDGPAPPTCDVDGCPDGAASYYQATFSGGSGDFAGLAGDYGVLRHSSLHEWTGGDLDWTVTYVPGNPGVLTVRSNSDPTGVYAVYSIAFGSGCCGTATGWTLVDSAGVGTPPAPRPFLSITACDCGVLGG